MAGSWLFWAHVLALLGPGVSLFSSLNLEKTRAPCSLVVSSAIFCTGYLSGSVWRFSHRKPLHGRQDPSTFLTMWSGDAQLLDDLWIITCFSSDRNSSSATASFSASSRRYLDAGPPKVMILCRIVRVYTVGAKIIARDKIIALFS